MPGCSEGTQASSASGAVCAAGAGVQSAAGEDSGIDEAEKCLGNGGREDNLSQLDNNCDEETFRNAAAKLNSASTASAEEEVAAEEEGATSQRCSKIIALRKKKFILKLIILFVVVGTLVSILYLMMHNPKRTSLYDLDLSTVDLSNFDVDNREIEADFEIIYESLDLEDASLDSALRDMEYGGRDRRNGVQLGQEEEDELLQISSPPSTGTSLPNAIVDKLSRLLNLSAFVEKLADRNASGEANRSDFGTISAIRGNDSIERIEEALVSIDKYCDMIPQALEDMKTVIQNTRYNSSGYNLTPETLLDLHHLQGLIIRVKIVRNRYVWLRQWSSPSGKLLQFARRFMSKFHDLLDAAHKVFKEDLKEEPEAAAESDQIDKLFSLPAPES